MRPRLTAITGPLEGKSFEIGTTPLTIGRHPSNQLQLTHISVSRHHCVIRPDKQRFTLVDLESRHGTFVNGLPIKQRRLKQGDVLKVSDSLFLFERRALEASDEVVSPVALDEGEYIAESSIEICLADALYTQPDQVRARLDPGAKIAHHLLTLLEIGSTLGNAQGVEPIARRLMERVAAVVPAERIGVLLFRRSQELTRVYAYHRQGGREERLQISRTITQRVTQERVAVLSNDVLHTQTFDAATSLQAARIHSLLCVPLVAGDAILGVLYADSRDPDSHFDEDHLQLLAATAGLAAQAFRRARHATQLEDELQRLRRQALASVLVGESAAMGRVFAFIERVAGGEGPLLLGGESGTGKNLVARAIHSRSSRAQRPFLTISCRNLAENLLASEIFGHEKGSFSGALRRENGALELADGGTVLLDEVGDMSLALQARLLAFLETSTFRRLGGDQVLEGDVRLIASSSEDLEAAVQEGTFREALFYRLNVIALHLPTLRQRRDDIPLLVSHFAARNDRRRRPAGLSTAARTYLQAYTWPGNVRELESAVEHALLLGNGDLIRPEDLPEHLLDGHGQEELASPYRCALDDAKRQILMDALKATEGELEPAADALGLHPDTLRRLLRGFRIETG